MKSDLHSQLVTLEEEISFYKRSVTEKEELCSNLQSQILVLTQQLESQESGQSKTMESDYQLLLSEKEDKISKLSDSLKEVEEVLRLKEEALSEMEVQSGTFNDLLQSLQLEVRSKTELVNELQAKVNTSEVEKGQLEEEKLSLAKDLDATSEKIVDLSNKLVQQEEKYSTVLHELKILSKELSIHEHEGSSEMCDSLRICFHEHQSKLDHARQELQTSLSEKERLSTRIQELEGSQNQQVLDSLQSLNQELQTQVEQLSSQLSALQTEHQHKMRSNISSDFLDDQIKELQADKENLEHNMQRLETERDCLQTESDTLKQEIEKERKARIESDDNSERLRSNVEAMQTELIAMKATTERLQDEIADVKSALEASEQQTVDTANQLEGKLDEINRVSSLLENANSENDFASARIESLEQEISELKSKLSENDNEIRDLLNRSANYDVLLTENNQLKDQLSISSVQKEDIIQPTVAAVHTSEHPVQQEGWGGLGGHNTEGGKCASKAVSTGGERRRDSCRAY